jgi:hypothetical protein
MVKDFKNYKSGIVKTSLVKKFGCLSLQGWYQMVCRLTKIRQFRYLVRHDSHIKSEIMK